MWRAKHEDAKEEFEATDPYYSQELVGGASRSWRLTAGCRAEVERGLVE